MDANKRVEQEDLYGGRWVLICVQNSFKALEITS
jgi:hypothetical protein